VATIVILLSQLTELFVLLCSLQQKELKPYFNRTDRQKTGLYPVNNRTPGNPNREGVRP